MPVIVLPAPTISVPYDELEGSPTEGIDQNGPHATRRLKCAWTDRWTLALQLAGSVTRAGSTTFRTLPAQFPWRTGCHVDSEGIEIAPFDEDNPQATAGDTKLASYSQAVLTIPYKSGIINNNASDEGDNADVLVEESVEPYAEFITLPADGFAWSDDNAALKPGEEPAKLYRGFNWVYTINYAPTIPAAVFSLLGKVNDSAVVSKSLGYRFGAGTLLYQPPVMTRQTTTDGQNAWRLTLKFSFRESGWNFFWRNDTGTWQSIVNASDSSPADPYESGDFLSLIVG